MISQHKLKSFFSFLLILTALFSQISTPLQSDELITSELVDIQVYIPRIQVDLKYATTDNFTGQVVYDFQTCLVLKEVALLLCDVQSDKITQKLPMRRSEIGISYVRSWSGMVLSIYRQNGGILT